MEGAPIPWELVRVDMTAKEINLPVVVLGTAARDLLGTLFRQTGSDERKSVDLGQAAEATFTYLELKLGDIRGFATRVHLYGFETDTRLAGMLGEYARAAAGAVLAFHQPPDADATAMVSVIARSIAPKIPVAALGPPEVSKSWQALHDTPPVMTAAADDESIFRALKAVAHDMLSALRSG